MSHIDDHHKPSTSSKRNSLESNQSTISTVSSQIEAEDFVGIVGEWGEVVIRGGTIGKFVDSLCPEDLPGIFPTFFSF